MQIELAVRRFSLLTIIDDYFNIILSLLKTTQIELST